MVAIAPQLVEHNATIKSTHGIGFPVLSDPGNAYTSSLGLTFTLPTDLQEVYTAFGLGLPDYNGDDSWKLPMPARIIVDRQGIMRNVDAHPDYTRRPEIEATLELVRAL